MTKAEKIVAAIFTVVNYPMETKYAYGLCIEKVEEILNKKCDHPMGSIKACIGSKSNWKCEECGKEVIPTKYEEVK